MRIAFTLGLLLLLSVSVNSQQRISHDWIVGYTHMDTYPRSIYSSSSPAGWPDTNSRSLFFFYRFGANLNIHLNNSFTIKTGMRFINSGQLISSDWYSDNGQDAEGNDLFEFQGRQQWYNQLTGIEIPLAMRYTLGKSSFRPFLEIGGMAYGYFFGIDMRRGVENTWATGNAFKNFRYFDRSYVDLFGSFGLEVDFSNERTMFFQPIVHRRIHNNFLEGEMVVYQVGFELGMRKFL